MQVRDPKRAKGTTVKGSVTAEENGIVGAGSLKVGDIGGFDEMEDVRRGGEQVAVVRGGQSPPGKEEEGEGESDVGRRAEGRRQSPR